MKYIGSGHYPIAVFFPKSVAVTEEFVLLSFLWGNCYSPGFCFPIFRICRQQDEELDELSASVERIGGVGLTIHEELLAQVCIFCRLQFC